MFARKARNSASRRRHIQPALERLEDRCVPATIRTWTGEIDDHWNFDKNWRDPSNSYGLPQPGDILVFGNPASVPLSFNDLPTVVTFDSIQFVSSGNSINGNGIRLSGSVPVTTSNTGGFNIIGLPIDLQGQTRIDVNGATSSLRIDRVISGTAGLTKRGPGTLQLTAGNNYAGPTDIQAGMLQKTQDVNVIPDVSAVTVAKFATLDLNNTSEGIDSLSGFGTIELGGNGGNFLSIGGAGSSTFFGQITGAGGLVVGGGGTFTLAGVSNPFTGRTFVVQGTLVLATTGPDNLAIGGPLEIGAGAGTPNFTGTVRLDRNHAIGDQASVLIRADGTLNVNGRQDFIGALTINGGLVTIGGAGMLATNGLMTFNGGGISATGNGFVMPLADVLFKADSGAPSFIDARVELAGRAQTFNIEDAGVSSDLTVFGSITGNQGLTKTGPGTLSLGGANGFTGTTEVREGTLLLAGPANSSILGPLVIGDGSGGSAIVRLQGSNPIADTVVVTVKSDGLFDVNGKQEFIGPLTVQGGAVTLGTGQLAVNSLLDMTGGTISSTGAGSLLLNGNVLTRNAGSTAAINSNVDLAGGVRSFNVEVSITPFYDLDINGVISNGGFIKNGEGILRFLGSAANTYTGDTTVNSGFLILSKPAGVAAIAGRLVMGDGVGTQGALQIDSNEQIADTSAVIIRPDGFLQLASGSETIGPLSMTGGVIRLFDQRVLTLSADVTFTSAASSATIDRQGPGVIPGTLSLGGASRTFTVLDGAAAVDLNIDVAIAQSATTGLIKAGPGTMALNKSVALGGQSSVTAGTLVVNDLLSGPVTVSPGATLTGGGTVGAATMQDGSILSPGNSVGLLGTGNLTLGDATRVIIEIQNINPGTQDSIVDSVDARGAVNLGARARLELVPLNAANFPVGTKLPIIQNDGTDPVLGTFANLPEGATANGRYRISYHGGDGNDVVLTRIASYIVTGSDAGVPPRVRVFDVAAPHNPKFDFLAYPGSFKGGVRVASADVNGDGYLDIITAPGPGARAIVKVFSGNTQAGQTPQLLSMLQPYGSYKGGAFVATGDVDRDGVPDIIVAPGKDTAPMVKIFSGANGGLIGMFKAFGGGFKGGVTVAAGDVDGDGDLDIVAGSGPGAKARVRVFDAASRTQLAGPIGSFLAYPASFTGGVFVAAADVSGDRAAEIITGPGPGTAPTVKIFTTSNVFAPRQIVAFPPGQKRGLRVAAADLNGDGKDEILTALGPQGNAEVRIFSGVTLAAVDRFFADAANFRRGLFLAGSR